MPSELEIAWATGLFEGEGYISTRKQHRRNAYLAKLVLEMNDQDVVNHFHQVVGVGRVHFRPATSKRPKAMWRWECTRFDDIRALLEKFLPLLGQRRSEAARTVIAWPIHRLRTHCKKGHLRTEENTYVKGDRRECKDCRAERWKRAGR